MLELFEMKNYSYIYKLIDSVNQRKAKNVSKFVFSKFEIENREDK
jgi:hypothetical protein